MRCQNCNQEIPDNSLVCPYCGQKPYVAPPTVTYPQSMGASVKPRTIIGTIGGIVLAIIVCLVGYYLLTSTNYIETIKNDSPDGYSITYETMFNKELSGAKWEYDSDTEKVIVTGVGGGQQCKFVFDIYDQGGGKFYYELTEANVGGIPFYNAAAAMVVLEMFDEAATTNYTNTNNTTTYRPTATSTPTPTAMPLSASTEVTYRNYKTEYFSVDLPDFVSVGATDTGGVLEYSWELINTSSIYGDMEIKLLETFDMGDDDDTDSMYSYVLSNLSVSPGYKTKKDNWFVVSWDKNGRVNYLKCFVKHAEASVLIMSYDKDNEQQYDDMVTHISRSFNAS